MFDFSITVIEQQYLIVGLALFAHHHGSTYLAEPHSMAPALAS